MKNTYRQSGFILVVTTVRIFISVLLTVVTTPTQKSLAQTINWAFLASMGLPWQCGDTEPRTVSDDWFVHWSQPGRGLGASIDFNAPGETDRDKDVLAPFEGRVTAPANNDGGYGNYVIIDAGNGWTVHLAHLLSISVQNNQWVPKGTVIGRSDSTGKSSGTHIHFELRWNGEKPDVGWFAASGNPIFNYRTNDLVSSSGVSLYSNNCGIGPTTTLFWDKDWGGRSIQFFGFGNFRVPKWFDNQASSIRLQQNVALVKVKENSSLTGGSIEYRKDTSNLEPDKFDNGVGVNDNVSAISVGGYYFCSNPVLSLSGREELGADCGQPIFSITPRGYDDIAAVLARPGLGYSRVNIKLSDLSSFELIKNYSVLFINCAGGLISSPQIVNALREYVQSGGSIYASDFAYEYVKETFPNFIQFASPNAKIGQSQIITAQIVDRGLANYINPVTPPYQIELNYDLSSWVVISSVSSNTTVHVQGNVKTFDATTSETLVESESHPRNHNPDSTQSAILNKPLVVSFRPYSDFGGRVIFTTFHNEAQQSINEKKLLEYLILTPFTFAQQEQIAEKIDSANLNLVRTDINTVNKNISTLAVGYEYTGSVVDKRLAFAVSWSGSTLSMSIYRPDGTIFTDVVGSNPPLMVVIQDPQFGEWKYRVTGIDIPYANYPFVVGVGTEKVRQTYLPIAIRNASLKPASTPTPTIISTPTNTQTPSPSPASTSTSTPVKTATSTSTPTPTNTPQPALFVLPEGIISAASSVTVTNGCADFYGSIRSDEEFVTYCDTSIPLLELDWHDHIKKVKLACAQYPNINIKLWEHENYQGNLWSYTCNSGPVFIPSSLTFSEPNNTTCQAYPITAGVKYTSRIDDKDDFFRLNVPTTSTLFVTVTDFTTSGQMQIRKSIGSCDAGQLYSSGSFQGDPLATRQITVFTVVPGDVFIRVASALDIAPNTDYGLTANLVTGSTPLGPFEPNNTACQAAPIESGTTYQAYPEDSSDWYSFTLSSNSNVVLNLTNLNVTVGQYILYKADNCSQVPGSLTPITVQDKSVTTRDVGTQSAGTYYLRVAVASGIQNTSLYNLRVDMTPVAQIFENGFEQSPGIRVTLLPEVTPIP